MTLAARLDEAAHLGPQAVRTLGEELRSEAERLARTDPGGLAELYTALRAAVADNRMLEPWALWAEGTAEQLLGHPAVSEPLLVRSGRLFRRRGDQHTAARVDIALMDALACLGRHRQASRRGHRAVRTLEACGDQPRTVAALFNLGGLADARDRIRDALALWRRARSLVEPDDLLRRGAIECNIANALQATGRFGEAEALYERAIDLLDRAGAPVSALHPRLGLAEVGALLGNIGTALAEIHEVEECATGHGDDNLRFEARLLRVWLELELGRAERASRTAAETMPECASAGRHGDAARLAALRALAITRGAEGDPDDAVREAERALQRSGLYLARATMRIDLAVSGLEISSTRLRRDVALLQRSGLAVQADLARLALAGALFREGRTSAAARQCNAVLGHRRASVRPRIEARRLLASLTAVTDPATSLRHLRQAVRLAESVRGRLRSETDRSSFAARHQGAYEQLVEHLLRRGDTRSRRQAFDLVAQVKSRGLVEALDRRQEQQWSDSPELLQRWGSLRRELAATLAALEGRAGERSRYATPTVERHVRRIARRIEDLEVEMARTNPGLGRMLGREPVPRLRPLMAPGELFLEMYFAGSDLVIFELDHQGLGVVIHRGCRTDVEQAVDGVCFQLSKAAYGRRLLESPGAVLVDQTRVHLKALGELVLSPLASRADVRQLYVAPHGLLHHVPIGALELDDTPALERCPVAVVPSSGVLAQVLASRSRRPRRIGVAGSPHEELPEIGLEVASVATVFAEATVAPSADRSAVRQLLTECDIVHVASHGAFQPLFPAGSGLRLGDGWLTTLDLARLRIRARLITLGACASGQMAVAPGEELVGVVRALVAGGARSVIAAPGALDDALARRAAQLFYEQLTTLGPGEALRRALLALRSDHPHPALWAGLQLYGDPRPWEDEA